MAAFELIDAGLAGAVGGFTTRHGGASLAPWQTLNLALHVEDDPTTVSGNRGAVAARLGVTRVAFPEQVHGTEVAVISGDVSWPPVGAWVGGTGCDAVVTDVPGVAVGVLVADCMPILLADPAHGVVAAAHAGRRGLAAGVLEETVAAMARLGAEPASTQAVIGPAICGRCYEVPESMRAEVAAAVSGTASKTREGTPGLDLPAGALGLLEAAGVSTVTDLRICTAEDARLYSYRRDGLTGRFAGIVMLATDG